MSFSDLKWDLCDRAVADGVGCEDSAGITAADFMNGAPPPGHGSVK